MLETRYSTESEESNVGLKFRLHHPHGSETKGLVLMVHGRAGSFDSKWVFARALRQEGFAVIAPQAPIVDGLGGFSWWEVSTDSTEARKGATREDLEQGLASLTEFLNKLPSCFPEFEGKPVIASGFSQGAGLLSTLSLEQPSLFNSVALLCGFIPRFVYEKTFELNNPANYFIFHGTEDQVIPLEKAHRARDFLSSKGAPVTYFEDDVGHKVSSDGIRELASWASTQKY